MNKIIHGDSLDVLKTLETDSVDCVVTDPPYGYSFMGKAWDKALPDIGIFKETLRVLKPGAFAFVMSAPRSDVCSRMAILLEDAGFNIAFTPIYWTYASGFPKAMNIGKMVDKRNGVERKVVSEYRSGEGANFKHSGNGTAQLHEAAAKTIEVTKGSSILEGSYGGFQPKPAVEVIIVAMKPLSEKTYVDQALKNGKGITWLDDVRVPTTEDLSANFKPGGKYAADETIYKLGTKTLDTNQDTRGRFPANLLVSDDVLNDGRITKSTGGDGYKTSMFIGGKKTGGHGLGDSGSFSRYFDLDAWARENLPEGKCWFCGESLKADAYQTTPWGGRYCSANHAVSFHDSGPFVGAENLPKEARKTLPFLIVPKASKGEKNAGLSHLEAKDGLETRYKTMGDLRMDRPQERRPNQNNHPTVKPLKLMAYLIQLGSRPGDLVLDPFCGSGTTCIAAKELGREFIGIEREAEYVDIAEARLAAVNPTLI